MADKEKADIEEIMSTDIAKALIAEAEPRNTPSVIAAVGNNRGRTLRLYATTSWDGSFFTPPPQSFNAGETARFSHNGSRGALIYGQEQGSPNAAGYLLAWSMGRNFGRRVYVNCGPLSEIHRNGWESAALTSLNSSGVSSSATDDQTASSIRATNADATGSFPLGAVSAVLA
ncbi:jasmonate-induced protein homolog [Silene latifolia]|uniref:jasmonate-induced protein homolog n=1 Tax=Silene latifolia TaxID=37657 RepID=UPI003D775F87